LSDEYNSYYSSLYCCKNSSKCITKHRILDNISDCYLNDDEEDYKLSCMINDILRFKCTIENKCYSFVYPLKEICPSRRLRNLEEIPFAHICDQTIQVSSVMTNGQNYTDETECEDCHVTITIHDAMASGIIVTETKNFVSCIGEKEKSINVLKQEFEIYELINSSSFKNTLHSIQVNINTSSTSTVDTTLKRKNLLSQCFDSEVNVTSQSSDPYQGINDYLAADFSHTGSDNDSSDDIDLLLWRQQQHSFPILSSMAKVVCAIPASNTTIERLSSTAKNVVTEKITRLHCEKINQMLFLQKNMNILKELLNSDFRRKRTASMSSTTTVSSEESTCTVPKQLCLDVVDSFNDANKENILD
ncbi:unnamed protein product, partial [Rotaria magnacalcarata]